MANPRLIAITLLFVGAFAIIGQLAWTTAADTTSPWFSPEISRQIYSTTMIGALIVVATLVALASSQVAVAGRESRALDLRLAILRAGGATGMGPGIDIDADIEETLDEILGGANEPPAPVVTVDREAHETLVTVATTEGRGMRQDVALREVARARAALQKAANRIWTGVGGPIAGAMMFLGIAGAMLPGAEGFAEAHFVMNTALILFLGYGWTLLAGWMAVALGFSRTAEAVRTPKQGSQN